MAVVRLKNIEIKLDSDLAIKNLSLKIDKGEFVYLIGKTGSGKSSILKALYSEKKIICGEAKIGQTDLKQLKENPLNLWEIQNSANNDSTFQEIFRLMHSRQPLIEYINNRWELSQWGHMLAN